MKATIDCEVCGKLYEVNFEAGEQGSVVCPKCGSDNIFFRDVEFNNRKKGDD